MEGIDLANLEGWKLWLFIIIAILIGIWYLWKTRI